MRRFKILPILIIIVAGLSLRPFISPPQAAAQFVVPGERPILSEAPPEMALLEAGAPAYVFSELRTGTFLRSDGSAVLTIESWMRNDSSVAMDRHTWCFYWGEDKYRSVFAKDAYGYMKVRTYEQFSDVFGKWGLCIEAPFHHAIKNGGKYAYTLGITIDGHHTVQNGILKAGWAVKSSSKVETYSEKVSWPYNHKGVVANPRPDTLGASYAQWKRTAADLPWEFTVNLSVTLGDQLGVEPISQGTLPFDGKDISWEDDPYGVKTGKSIGEWGCYLVAGTMAINYFADVLGAYGQIDPAVLNAWLAAPATPGSSVPRGYARAPGAPAGSYSLVYSYVFDDASQDLFDTNGPLIKDADRESPQSFAVMRAHLQNGELGLLNVTLDGESHFVLATGYTTVNGVETVTINDPWLNRGSTTLLAQYKNQYLSVRWFRPGDQGVRPNYVILYAQAPVELLVTDDQGRRTGYDPRSGEEFQEIPGSAYVTEYTPGDIVAPGEGTKVLQIESYQVSQYRVEVFGQEAGAFTVDFAAALDSGETDLGSFSGVTQAGEADVLNLTFDPNVGFWKTSFLPMVSR